MLMVWSEAAAPNGPTEAGLEESTGQPLLLPRGASALRIQLLWDFLTCSFPGFSADRIYASLRN